MSNLVSVTASLFVPAAAIARATANAQSACNAWSTFCAAGLVGVKPSLTLDGIGEAMLSAYNAKQPAKRRVTSLSAMNKAGGQGGVVYGWFRMLARIAAAGDSQLSRLATEGLYTVGRGIVATQPQAKKGGKGRAKTETVEGGAPETVAPAAVAAVAAHTLTLADVAAFLVTLRKSGTAANLAKQEAALSVVIQESANLGRMVATYRKAQAEAKPVRKSRARKAA